MGNAVLGSWTDLEFLSGQPQLTETRAREQTAIQSRMSARGYEVRLSKLSWPGGGELRLASSTCWLNTILTPTSEGSCTPRYSGGCGLIAGSMMLAPPDAPILVRWAEPEILVLTCLFDPGRIMSLGGLDWNGTMEIDGDAQPALVQPFTTASDLLAREMLHPDLASEIKIESLVIYLACQLHSRLVGPGVGGATRHGLDARQLRLIRELATSTSQTPTAGSIAECLGISVRMLGQLFKTTTGGTLRAYLAEQRIDQARRLLATPGLQIKKVAALAGFSTTSAFAAAFRNSTGSTPQQFRAAQQLRRES